MFVLIVTTFPKKNRSQAKLLGQPLGQSIKVKKNLLFSQ